MKRLHPSVPVKTHPRSFSVYGLREFAYDASKTGDRERALSEAERYGFAMQEAMAKRIGRPLTTREQVTLVQEQPKPEPYSGSLRRDKPVVNPWRARLDEVVKKMPEVQGWERDRKRVRIEELQARIDQWDQQQAAREASAALKASPEYEAAAKDAASRYAKLLLTSDASQQTVEAAASAMRALESGAISPAQYFAAQKGEPLPSPGEGVE